MLGLWFVSIIYENDIYIYIDNDNDKDGKHNDNDTDDNSVVLW